MKVHLRSVERSDLPWLLLQRNDPQLNVNFNQPVPLSMGDMERWYEHQVLDKKCFAWIVKLEDSTIGYIALQNINWITHSAEISHFITSEYEQQTFAFYAHYVLLQTAFASLNFNRIHTVCFSFNKVKKTLESLGFKQEGVLRQACYRGNRYHDSYLMAILKEDYKLLFNQRTNEESISS